MEYCHDMKRGRRVIPITAIVLLVILLGLIGTLKWLQSSGRLTQYAQKLVQAHSGQNLSFQSVTFTSWNVIALTDVRLQQRLPGWRLDVTCPRVEAHYTLQGLRRKQMTSVRLMRPAVHLQTSQTAAADSGGGAPAGSVLPVERIDIQDALLRVDHGDTPYILTHLEASVHQIAAPQVSLDVRASVDDDTAQVHIKGDMSLDLAHPTGTFDISLSQVNAPRLATKGLWPADWTLTKGSLNLTSQIEIRDQALHGTLQINLTQGHGDIAAVAVQGATVATDMTFEADMAARTLTLQGPMQLQAAKVLQAASGLLATELTAQLPVQLTYAPGQWHVHTDLRLQGEHAKLATAGGVQLQQFSHTASIDAKSIQQGWSLQGELAFAAPRVAIASMQLNELSGTTPVTLIATPKQWQSSIALSLRSQALSAKNAFQIHQLSSQLPLEIQSTPGSWRIQGTVGIEAHRMHVGAANRATTSLAFERVQSQLPLHITSTALTARDAHIQAQAVHWQPDTASPITSPLNLHTTVDLNWQRQQLDAQHLILDLPTLGHIKGSGAWQWTTGTTRDVRLSIAPTALEAVWLHLAALLPAPYPTWTVTGQTRIDLTMPHAEWRHGAPSQPLAIEWHVSDMAFSSPEGDYAGENVNGQVRANVSLASNWRPASVQASLTLKPFAILMGSFFPQLENNNVTSTVTLNSQYHPQTGYVDLNVNSQFGSLGRITIEGKLNASQTPMQADVICRLHQIDVTRTWQTFMPETLRQAAEPPVVQGQLNARLQLRGALAKTHLQGDLQLASGHLQTGSFEIRNLSLQLPVDIHYPLPEHPPDLAALPAAAYGQLHLEHIQFNGLQIPGITTKLALRSDSVIFQKDIQAALLKGVLHLQDLVAYHVLRPQRQIRMQMRLRSLQLQDIQRDAAALPIAGRVDADFSRLHFQNGRLQTEGSLQLRVAGGRIRVYDVAGWDLGSQIPSIQGSLKTEVPLSLHELTRIYPIGAMGGTLHVAVDDLTMTAGEPAAFLLHFYVQQKGGEARQITLRALNNLLFTTGSAQVETGFAYQLPYRSFGAEITLQHDTLRLRGLYQDNKGREYFMRAPPLGGGVSIINRTPQNGIAFRNFVQRLKSTVIERPDVRIK